MRTIILAIEFFALLTDLIQLGESPHVVYKDGSYERIALTDSTQMEVYNGADTILVVLTACAPQCSSCARVYNKEGQLIAIPQSPTPSIFPLATIENGRIVWKDNDNWEY